MAPFSMKCLQCGEYIYRGRKFNARKETPLDEKYLGIQIFRFYIKCTRCSAEICFKTDPKNNDYACERGAKRNTEPWRVGREETDEERLDRLEKEEEERDAMVELEAKTVDAKREMAVADALDEIRTRNARVERADRDGLEVAVAPAVDEEAERQEREDAEAARRAFSARHLDDMITVEIIDDGESSSTSSSTLSHESNGTTLTPKAVPASPGVGSGISTDMPPPSFKRVVKKKKDHAALLGIKKKPSLV
ncbi:CWC16 protein [Xylaria acuta]|nr:CWC16 protein [Xylaria acuta]